MKLKDLIRSLENPLIHDPLNHLDSLKIDRLIIDSRKATPHTLFVAVEGLQTDGHHYLPQVIERGCKACVVQKKQPLPPLPNDTIQIEVSDTRQALSQLACEFYAHPSRDLCFTGVTGTNGKTTSTYLLESIFRQAGVSPGVIGTVNYRYARKEFLAPLTTPDSIEFQSILREMKDHGVTHVISEISSHALKLNRVDGTQIDVALFTNLTQDHLDFHAGFEDYYESKKRLFTDILTASSKKNKVSVINIDDPYGLKLLETLRKLHLPLLTYGLSHPDADVSAQEFSFDIHGLTAKVQTPQGSLQIQSPLVGQFNLLNLLGVVAVAIALNLPKAVIEKGISILKNVPGRLERIADGGMGILVLVDYAHTDDALKNVGRALTQLKKKRIISVFGCGGDRDRKKRPLMARASVEFSDIIIVTSDNPRTEDPLRIIDEILVGLKEVSFPSYNEKQKRGYLVCPDRKLAIYKAIELATPSDIVLIAGKGHEDYQILGKTKIHFDDREIATEALCLKQKKL